MYQSIYEAIAADTASEFRENERAAFLRSIDLLKLAQSSGRETREAVEAIHFVVKLWSFLLEDLSGDGNGLPDSLKASLISIGIWILKRAEDIRQGRTDDLSALIEVSESIYNGLGKT
jgi:flagellar biosynthesis activator protein FlaF